MRTGSIAGSGTSTPKKGTIRPRENPVVQVCGPTCGRFRQACPGPGGGFCAFGKILLGEAARAGVSEGLNEFLPGSRKQTGVEFLNILRIADQVVTQSAGIAAIAQPASEKGKLFALKRGNTDILRIASHHAQRVN
jgi:hypothetical protein